MHAYLLALGAIVLWGTLAALGASLLGGQAIMLAVAVRGLLRRGRMPLILWVPVLPLSPA